MDGGFGFIIFWRLLNRLAEWLDSKGLLYTKEELEQLKREAEMRERARLNPETRYLPPGQ